MVSAAVVFVSVCLVAASAAPSHPHVLFIVAGVCRCVSVCVCVFDCVSLLTYRCGQPFCRRLGCVCIFALVRVVRRCVVCVTLATCVYGIWYMVYVCAGMCVYGVCVCVRAGWDDVGFRSHQINVSLFGCLTTFFCYVPHFAADTQH